MFYFFLPSIFSYNILLVAAAVVPAVILMIRTYRADKLEKESSALLWKLVRTGIFSSLIALVAEWILEFLLDVLIPSDTLLYGIVLYYVVVALSEECAKYFLMKRRTWTSPEFNCQYDALVYALFVSLGFALWENISYVMTYGISVAFVRALTAIPGHACFGVFMGIFYGIARRYENRGDEAVSKRYRRLAVLVPVLLHGTYDYIASTDSSVWIFFGFVAVLFVLSYILESRFARSDRFI